MKDDLAELTAEIRRRVAELGFDLADFRRRGSSRRPLFQARIDIPDSHAGHGVTADDCAKVSRQLERWLEEEHIVNERYVLEVSSPGIERPIRWREHWLRFRGQDVNVTLSGLGRVRATIVSVEAEKDVVVLRLEKTRETVRVSIDDARDATLAVDWD